jgi:AraC-like DNA-binding protein
MRPMPSLQPPRDSEQEVQLRPRATYGKQLSVVMGAPATPTMRTPYHKVLIGPCVVRHARGVERGELLVVPGGVEHQHNWIGQAGTLIHVSPQRYRLSDARRLAHSSRKFVAFRDEPLELYQEASRIPEPSLERRLARALEWLDGGESIAAAARATRLSESRLSHLFSEQLGFSLRTWRSWLLVRRALLGLLTGGNLTRVAFDAGFADAAHLSRAVRSSMGATPTSLARVHNRFVTRREAVLDCDKLRARHGTDLAQRIQFMLAQ